MSVFTWCHGIHLKIVIMQHRIQITKDHLEFNTCPLVVLINNVWNFHSQDGFHVGTLGCRLLWGLRFTAKDENP